MKTDFRIGLIGDYDPSVTAHRAIPRALDLAAEALGLALRAEWVPTIEIESDARVSSYDALWCVPASPYRSTEGALRAIRFARTEGRPFLGTCGGCQHAILEYAQSVLDWADAEHAETSPEGSRLVIAPLACAMVEVGETILLRPDSRLAQAYGRREIREEYHCSYGISPEFQDALTSGDLKIAAENDDGVLRAFELASHPFFVLTLFQPERAALRGQVPAIVREFIGEAAGT